MKHHYYTTLFWALFMSMVTKVASAHDFEVDGIYYKITSTNAPLTVAVTFRGNQVEDYDNEYTGNVTIPETVTYDGNSYSVTKIDNNAFSKCYNLTSITIGGCTTSIGNGAFYLCTKLNSINLPNSLISIEARAFDSCGLPSITIPNGVTSIGSGAFIDSGLKSITISKSVTSIGYGACSKCLGLTSIVIEKGNPKYDSRKGCNAIIETATSTLMQGCKSTVIPDNVTSIGDGAFKDCRSITSIVIPDNIISIGASAFSGCRSLTSITIPNSVTSVGRSAFFGCTGLTSITISERITNLSDNMFDGCSGLTSITIPNGVTTIGERTFQKCTGLTSVAIPDSVTSMGIAAFSDCKGLTSVTIPYSMKTINLSAFNNCSSLTDVFCFAETVPNTGWSAFYYTVPLDSATLHVPAISLDTYKSTKPWSEFGTIIELTDEEFTGIRSTEYSMPERANGSSKNGQGGTEHVYDLNGRQQPKLQQGINVIQYSDGTTKRILVK